MKSKLWRRANDDSRAAQFRAKYEKENKGKWVKCKTGWEWEEEVKPAETVKETPKPKKKLFGK